jgi:hypothetical protein
MLLTVVTAFMNHTSLDRNCSTKESQPEEDPSVAARLQRLTNDYDAKGGSLQFPHVLLTAGPGNEETALSLTLYFVALAPDDLMVERWDMIPADEHDLLNLPPTRFDDDPRCDQE